ncbi:hypothetical protein BJX63DRAFT_60890 [Aspergillus granulosus]|uniref:Uncharacterized protein n=1 Tax=Aspergillus granulosus TaxID=176169 RepID=A0ABR4GXH4_9EURO
MSQSSLTNEVARLARLSNLQNGIPPAMRALPVAAILAGGVISRITGMSNGIEERLLGTPNTITLDNPAQPESASDLGSQPSANMGEERCQPNQAGNNW